MNILLLLSLMMSLITGKILQLKPPSFCNQCAQVMCYWLGEDFGISPLQRDCDTKSLSDELSFAIEKKNFLHVHCLIQNGAKTNVRYTSGDTPFYLVVKDPGNQCLSQLMRASDAQGALKNLVKDVISRDELNYLRKATLLLLNKSFDNNRAINADFFEEICSLASFSHIEECNIKISEAFHLLKVLNNFLINAAKGCKKNEVIDYIKKGASPFVRDKNGNYLQAIAYNNGCTEIGDLPFKELIKYQYILV